MTKVYINQISTAVPPYDVHQAFIAFASHSLKDPQKKRIFDRMAERSHIDHRYSYVNAKISGDSLDAEGFYKPGDFPSTKMRMQHYQRDAFTLAKAAIDSLISDDLTSAITHVIVTTCTGFYAPGIDLQIVEHYGLSPAVERTIVGFMGCYAAINALKLSYHIVRSNPAAKVLIVNIELCTLHLQETQSLQELLSFLIFADGCAASLVSAEDKGIEIESFYASVVPDTHGQITWDIGELGFDMNLSGAVPLTITRALPDIIGGITGGKPLDEIIHWAIHPGGRTILDAMAAIGIDRELIISREVLRKYGNMSSATIMFVLKEMMDAPAGAGCAMAFGPGVTVESMRFAIGAAHA